MNPYALANYLKNQGRGPDTTLVHMTPGEVAGLQSLAMAHGGSLTVNPNTGLYEAGFLSRILPALIGIGGSMMGAPAWAIGLGTGLSTYANTGNLGRGIMSGLTSYGFGALGEGLGTAGSQQAGQEYTSAIDAMYGKAGEALQSYTPVELLSGPTPTLAEFSNMTSQQLMSNDGMQALSDAGLSREDAQSLISKKMIDESRAAGTLPKLGGQMSTWEKMQKGFGAAQNAPMDFLKANRMPATMAGIGLLGMASDASRPKLQPRQTQVGTKRDFEYVQVRNPEWGPDKPGEPYYIQKFVPKGTTPLYDTTYYAEGGQIPAQNAMYPQANIYRSQYADPIHVPQANEVVGDYDASIDQYGNVLKA